MLVESGRVRLSHGPHVNRHRPSVDVLFRSAAETFGSRVIGVILSGALDDGAVGLQAIKQGGGIALVQDPKEAQQAGMPEAALRSVAVDEVLPLELIAARLVWWSRGKISTAAPVQVPALVNAPISKNAMAADEMVRKCGQPSVYACPDCSGPLWELRNGGLVRYQCLVGHSYSPASLMQSDAEALERAVWVAVRALEQRASLLRRLVSKARQSDLNKSSSSFEAKALECEAQARVIRQFLERIAAGAKSGPRSRRRRGSRKRSASQGR
jgi:two-component system chemotaxis response regulator CheB